MTEFSLHGIALALGGDVRSNRYVTAPGPQHSRRDRSLQVWIDEGGGVCCTTYSTADSWPDCIDYVRDRLGLPPFEPGRREKAHQDKRTPEEFLAEAIASWQGTLAEHRVDGRKAGRLWNEAINPTGTPAEFYLNQRHLSLPGDMAGRTVRFHPACPRGDKRLPALLVRFEPIVHPSETVPWGENPPVTCVQRIWLDASKPKGHDGKWLLGHPFDFPKPFLLEDRVTVGTAQPRQVMKLTPDEEVIAGLHLTEGFETGLAAMTNAFRPLWATYSSEALSRFSVLPGIESLTIVADHDQAGLIGAQTCAERWVAADREVLIRWPDGLGDDYADEVWP